MDDKPELVTGISDAVLLRSLAEDIPDMALTVREQLRHIAARLGDGELIGHLRCKRCGEKAEILITAASTRAAAELSKE